MQYTEDQQIAFDELLAWYKAPVKRDDPNTLLYVINGAAGTGKTTITKEVIRALGLRKHDLAVTAPTHQAKKVIQRATDFEASTIQKLLGLRPNVEIENFDIRNPQFDPQGEQLIRFYKVVILDEASMLNADSFEYIKETAMRYGVRIIFLGDSYQLPPVGEVSSKVFTNVANISTLRTVVRQGKDNPNTELLLGIRADIEGHTDVNLRRFLSGGDKIVGDKGYKVQDSGQFGADLLTFYRETEAKYDLNHIRMLTWTNKSVILWSDAIRRQLLGEQAQELLIEGESLIGYSTIQDYRTKDISLQNSDSYKVVHIQPDKSNDGVEGIYVTLINDEDREYRHFIVTQEGRERFTTIAFDLWKKARSASPKFRGKCWREFYGFKEDHLLIKPVNHMGMHVNKDLYYAYGMTVHKSQGSTFSNTAVNLSNIRGNRTPGERRRLSYVALSRCRNTNLILAK